MDEYAQKLILINQKLREYQKKEEKLLFKDSAIKKVAGKYTASLQQGIEEKIPDKLEETLKSAFSKAFHMIFKNGKVIIDKTYDEEAVLSNFDKKKKILGLKASKDEAKALKKDEIARYAASVGFTTAEGVGLGLLGIGIPDVPILIANLIRTCMIAAKSHGINPEESHEQNYMLMLIQLVAAPKEERAVINAKLDALGRAIDKGENALCVIENNMEEASKKLATAMLVSHFVMGLPVVGVAGGVYNTVIISQLHQLAEIKYEMRLLTRTKAELMREGK